MARLAERLLYVGLIIFSVWIALQLFSPLVGQVMGLADSMGALENTDLFPSWFGDGVIWSFTLFVLGLIGAVVIWAIARPLMRIGRGSKFR